MSARTPLVALAAGAVVAASVVAFEIGPSPVRLVFALPLLLVLPGYALTRAAFATRCLEAAQVVVLSVGSSIALAVLLALLLDVSVGLHRTAWAIVLAAVTIGATAVATIRTPASGEGRARRLPRVRRRDVLLLVGAGAIASGAIALARTPLPAGDAQGYTSLWLVPDEGSRARVRVGVTNGELHAAAYRLVVTARGTPLYVARRVRLSPGAEFERIVRLDRTHGGTIEARLYSRDSKRPLRRATLHMTRR